MDNLNVKKILSVIKAMREELGYSQAEMAKWSEMSTSFYGMIERGNRCLNIENLIKISNALDCDITDILEIAENN